MGGGGGGVCVIDSFTDLFLYSFALVMTFVLDCVFETEYHQIL